jgi:hypothetical protein
MNFFNQKLSDEFSRREFLRDASQKFLGVSLAPMLGGSLASQALGEKISAEKTESGDPRYFSQHGWWDEPHRYL